MLYLKSFDLLTESQEHDVVFKTEKRQIFNSNYPLGLFSFKKLLNIKFDNVTIFYGGNGSGKTTLLNIIAEKTHAIRKALLNKGSIFEWYVQLCDFSMSYDKPIDIKMITSDDIFDYLLDVRSINTNVNRRKETLSQEYLTEKYDISERPFNNYEKLKDNADSKRKTMSAFIRERLTNNNIIEQSNGESALMFWEKEIGENSLYILDEPENSLSAENQIKLKKFIEASARFYNCQFIISTHSPFILSIKDAKIYDLDENPVVIKKWVDLENVRKYYDFFKEHSSEFEK